MLGEKIWVYETAQADAGALSRAAGVSLLTAKVLVNRGITSPEQIRRFMASSMDDMADPFLLADMERAVSRMEQAVKDREKVVLYGDYDVDGITGTAVLLDFLKRLGLEAAYYIPDRADEGYGLSIGAIDRIIGLKPGLIVTIDCGITALDEVRYVNENQIDIIITDHHACKEILPPAFAVVNPCRPDCTYPFKELAGVGVVYRLVHALCLKMGLGSMYKRYLDLVAIGTVADVVPLLGENRILVKHGLPAVENTSNLGLRMLIDNSGLKGKPVNSFGIGFVLAPRINAAGRLGDAGRGVRLFTTDDMEEAGRIASELDEANRTRQETESEILQQVESLIASDADLANERVWVISGEGWHPGVIGIVASRITEKYCRPCILLSSVVGLCKGSGRSMGGFNLFKALTHCGELLDKYGGHEQAAGLTLQSAKLADFKGMINQYALQVLPERDRTPGIKLDALVDMKELTLENVKELELLAPFGCGNPNPLFACEGFSIDDVRTVGAGKHLKLKLACGGSRMDAIGFNMGGLEEILCAHDAVHVAFSPEINRWNNTETVQLNLRDLRFGRETMDQNQRLYEIDKSIESGAFNGYNGNIGYFRMEEIIPERQDMVAVYRYLKANCHGNMVIDNLFELAGKIAVSCRTGMNYLKVKKSMEVFEELKLLQAEPVGKYGMRVAFPQEVRGKANLENSQVYRKLQAMKKDWGKIQEVK